MVKTEGSERLISTESRLLLCCQSVQMVYVIAHGSSFMPFIRTSWDLEIRKPKSIVHKYFAVIAFTWQGWSSLSLENEAGASVSRVRSSPHNGLSGSLSPWCYPPKKRINTLVRQLVSFCGWEFNGSQLHSTHPGSGLSFKNEFSLR